MGKKPPVLIQHYLLVLQECLIFSFSLLVSSSPAHNLPELNIRQVLPETLISASLAHWDVPADNGEPEGVVRQTAPADTGDSCAFRRTEILNRDSTNCTKKKNPREKI